MPNLLLSVENLNVVFGSNQILRNITFSVERGESVAVIGESGCGKTVLLKTLINLHPQTSGQVLFDRCDLSQLSYFDLARIRTRFGFVFQQAALFDSMTIEENAAFPLLQHTKKTKSEIAETVKRLLHETGLDDETLLKKPAELSGGMRKRVGIARALALEPELMLYDEPTTGLDPVMSDVINDLMISVRERYGVTSIMVTHDLRSACKVARRIIMLSSLTKLNADEPQIIFDGTPEEFVRSQNKRVKQFTSVSV
ncbi:MAG: ATP-binding cassette domain-containing protein [Planctomycetaceae bacterium]|jgi:phospholipid/cholesterol/gamma-HCH transport system ATP-binding protein|nr:ATP-binding cassette domain-containing protein [Planctomycetaceae bacterium]